MDIRSHLQSELLERCKRNPRYSLRSFARALDIESSALSKILNGKRGVSPKMLERISDRLALSPTERSRFTSKPKSVSETGAYALLSTSTFEMISDWYHYAILELTHTKGFRPHPDWIARRLGITLTEAKSAIERLRSLGMLDGWKDRSGNITCVQDRYTASAYRKLQKQILTQAITALDEVPQSRRDTTALTMAIDPDKLPEARKRLQRFRRSLCRFLQSGTSKEVYQLSLSLFPVTQLTGDAK